MFSRGYTLNLSNILAGGIPLVEQLVSMLLRLILRELDASVIMLSVSMGELTLGTVKVLVIIDGAVEGS